jgi:hypothetical protein
MLHPPTQWAPSYDRAAADAGKIARSQLSECFPMTYARLAAVAAFAVASIAGAQTPAAPAAPATPATAAAPAAEASQCAKPDPHPGRIASNEKLRGWNKEVQTWQECMKKYIGDLQARADTAVKAANAAVADSNGAIASYNATVKELQAQADAAK